MTKFREMLLSKFNRNLKIRLSNIKGIEYCVHIMGFFQMKR